MVKKPFQEKEVTFQLSTLKLLTKNSGGKRPNMYFKPWNVNLHADQNREGKWWRHKNQICEIIWLVGKIQKEQDEKSRLAKKSAC